jgi:hypothetical protein
LLVFWIALRHIFVDIWRDHRSAHEAHLGQDSLDQLVREEIVRDRGDWFSTQVVERRRGRVICRVPANEGTQAAM